MTLIEVMVALLLAMVALLGALALVLTSSRGGAFSRNLTEASVLAQSGVEMTVARTTVTASVPADNLPGTWTTVETDLNSLGQVKPGDGPYTRRTAWTTSVVGSAGTRRVVTVEVSWVDALGSTHTVSAARERAL